MSTITLDYSNSLASRRTVNARLIVLLITGLVLVASVILVAASASANVDTASSVVAVPVQTAPAVDAQHAPEVPSTPAPNLIVVAVPAATPPAE